MSGTPEQENAPEALIDLSGLVAGLRRRQRLWLSLACVGTLLGATAAVLAPSPVTATARIYVVHEDGSSGNDDSVMDTDLAVLETTTVAAEAVKRLGVATPPDEFVGMYSGEVVAAGVLGVTARGDDAQQAVERVQAVADAFIAVHISQSEALAQAEVKALTDRRDEMQGELDRINAQINRPNVTPDAPSPLLDRRASLSHQIVDLTERAEDASLGSPRLVAGTRIIDTPRAAARSLVTSLVLFTGAGLVFGLGLGIAVAVVAAIVRDRPVLRRDIALHLGASVIAQLPAPLPGPSRLWRRGNAEKERQRTVATLARLVRAGPAPVSILELNCASVAAGLAAEVAGELATHGPVVLVDDLPGDELRGVGRPMGGVRVVDGRRFPGADVVPQGERLLAVGTVGPGAPWTDLRRLGVEALVVLRAGSAEAAWLHTVARQLADTGIAVVGVVVVSPDPRDRSDGTLWDGVHTAIRGRLAAATSIGLVGPEAVIPPAQDGPTADSGAGARNGRGGAVTASRNGLVPEADNGRDPGWLPGAVAVLDEVDDEAEEPVDSEPADPESTDAALVNAEAADTEVTVGAATDVEVTAAVTTPLPVSQSTHADEGDVAGPQTLSSDVGAALTGAADRVPIPKPRRRPRPRLRPGGGHIEGSGDRPDPLRDR